MPLCMRVTVCKPCVSSAAEVFFKVRLSNQAMEGLISAVGKSLLTIVIDARSADFSPDLPGIIISKSLREGSPTAEQAYLHSKVHTISLRRCH